MCHYVNNHCKCEKCEILDIHWLLGPIAVSDDCEVMMGAESLLSAMKLLLLSLRCFWLPWKMQLIVKTHHKSVEGPYMSSHSRPWAE